MRHSLLPAFASAIVALGACRAADAPPRADSSPALSGTVAVDGLSDAVRVVRDAWGVPHIYARSRDDLFIAQGFVQAQDRLFQMDLWRRAAQGRLSEVLGPNFIERDAMTRRVQYRGDLETEWNSYGRDAQAIAGAFVRGINAFVTTVRARPTEAFAVAGWAPGFWSPADLLNRTEAFVVDGGAIDEVARRHFSGVVADAVRRIGAEPFFVGLNVSAFAARKLPDGASADRELVSAAALVPSSSAEAFVREGVVYAAESPRRYENPSRRYLVHLNAPGWRVIGATAPWRPGVAIGHNEHIAWAAVPAGVDTQQLVEQPANASASRVIKDAIAVKGRAEPFEYDTELTPAGVVIASDRARAVNYTLKWAGFEPGTAPEMAALAIDAAPTLDEFRAAAARWKMPAARIVAVTSQQSSVVSQQTSVVSQRSSVARRAVFAHVFGISPAARQRFNVGPLARPADHDQPFRIVLVPRAWDESRVVNAPGQSESPDSAHFSDLAEVWSAGRMVPLLFSDEEVNANAQATLMLVPRK